MPERYIPSESKIRNPKSVPPRDLSNPSHAGDFPTGSGFHPKLEHGMITPESSQQLIGLAIGKISLGKL
jgi:hypothetical protein